MTNKTSLSFRIISILALVWNLIGVISYAMNIMMSDDAIAALPEAERTLFESTPTWITLVYGIAVFAGLAGSILLLLKKSQAVPLFLVSLIAVTMQMGHSLFISPLLDVYGPAGAAMPVIVIVLAVYFLWYSSKCKKEGIIL